MSNEFSSGFAGSIRDFLLFRAAMGRATDNYQNFLDNFDRFCLKLFPGASVLTEEIAFAWCNDANGNGGVQRGSILRGLGRFLREEGQDAYIMPAGFFPYKEAAPPHIFNNEELKRFFDATDRYPHCRRRPLLEYTVPVIFRLQFSCGLRPQEVRLLRRLDFDFSSGTIYISKTKHHKDRRIPVNDDVVKLCQNYDQLAETIMPGRTYFFQAASGEAYTNNWLTDTFDKCWELSGNGSVRGKHTPYSLRHNFATYRIMQWMEEGKDIEPLLIYLSTYMGHDKFSATYYYLSLIPERLSKMPFMRVDGVVPKVQTGVSL